MEKRDGGMVSYLPALPPGGGYCLVELHDAPWTCSFAVASVASAACAANGVLYSFAFLSVFFGLSAAATKHSNTDVHKRNVCGRIMCSLNWCLIRCRCIVFFL